MSCLNIHWWLLLMASLKKDPVHFKNHIYNYFVIVFYNCHVLHILLLYKRAVSKGTGLLENSVPENWLPSLYHKQYTKYNVSVV